MKISKKITAIVATIALSLVTAVPSNAKTTDSIRYKATFSQSIKHNKWVTLNFKGKDYIKGNGNRSLVCYQVVLNTKGKKKPKYVKVRITRLKSGKNDTTATNYYTVKTKPNKKFTASSCWEIETKYKIVAQVWISGGSKYYTSRMRQFKIWTPGAKYPADFSSLLPTATL